MLLFLLPLLLLGVATGLHGVQDHSGGGRLGLANGHRVRQLGSRVQTGTNACRSSVNLAGVECRPNVIFLMTDQWNYPMPYENAEIKEWRKTHLKGENYLRETGFEFHRHYVGSIACAPSRATLFTGHYPSLHGVSQTDGMAKPLTDPRRWPLFPATVPTMGNYFRAGGYSTYYKGKWHVGDSDIYIPGTRTAVHSYNGSGVPIPEIEKLYYDRLEEFGFSEWVGPEPHGASPYNSAFSAPCNGTGCYSGRDDVYTEQLIDIVGRLNKSYTAPFFLVGSLLGVHDIVLYGDLTKNHPLYNFPIDATVPSIPPAPTARENLTSKPACQRDWQKKFHLALQPTNDTEEYRKFYYSLALKQDANLKKILDVVANTVFHDNTIIVWTSDHGEYLGAHGLRAKWFSGYEEVTHVPCLFKLPSRLRASNSGTGTQVLSSHLDLLPTLLGLTNLPQAQLQAELALTFTDAQPLVGRDVSSLITGKGILPLESPPVWIQIEDQILTGTNQISPVTNRAYSSVIQPASVQVVLAYVQQILYKYVRYYDNTQWWTHASAVPPYDVTDGVNKTSPVADEYELYDITRDPTEVTNLLISNSAHQDPAIRYVETIMKQHLTNECNTKRLKPHHAEPGYPPGWMPCV